MCSLNLNFLDLLYLFMLSHLGCGSRIFDLPYMALDQHWEIQNRQQTRIFDEPYMALDQHWKIRNRNKMQQRV